MKKLQYIWLAVVLALTGTATAQTWETVVVGPGGNPKWSPEGSRLAVWQQDRVDIYDVEGVLLRSIESNRPTTYLWITEDTLGLSYKDWVRINGSGVKVLTNGVLSVDGEFQSLIADTVFAGDSVSISPWLMLSDGSVGVFETVNFEPVRYLRYAGGKLSISEADTSALLACRSRFDAFRNQYQFTISPDCNVTFAYRLADPVTCVVLDSSGNELIDIGTKFKRVDDRWISGLILPKWSYSSKYLSLVRSVEDGHIVLRDDILIVDVVNGSIREAVTVGGGFGGEIEWCPTSESFVFTAETMGGVVMCRLRGKQ